MPLHTKKEFAAMCGMTTKRLADYALKNKRKVVYTGEYVDSSIEPNFSFLQKWKDKNRDKIIATSGNPIPEPIIEKEKAVTDKKDLSAGEAIFNDLSGVFGLDAKKMQTQIIKMEKEIEKLTLNNQKAMGQVVPVSLIDSIFLQERQSILIESKNALQDILTIFAKRRDITAEERADISSEFTNILNRTMKRSAEATTKAVDEIVREFSIKRGKGERL